MKYIIPFLPVLLVGCAQLKGNSQTGEYAATFVMTDFQGYSQTSRKAVMMGVRQSTVPVQAIKAAERAYGYGVAANLSEALSNNSTKEVLGAQGVTQAANAGRETTKQLGITTGAEVEKLRIITPKP